MIHLRLKKRIIAEARFLRAMNYFNLVRLFGDVVFFGDEYVANPVAANNMTRTDINVIYDFIIDELLKAEPDLWNRELTEKGQGKPWGRPGSSVKGVSHQGRLEAGFPNRQYGSGRCFKLDSIGRMVEEING